MNNKYSDINIKSTTENKDFLNVLVAQLEDLIEQDNNLPFHIKQLKDNGFLIKVRGLLAFVSFDYMPWRYKNKENWKATFKSIKGKQFYGKVYQLQKDPLFILFNANIPQFKPVYLTEGEKYNGIIIEKTKKFLIIDFGDHFHWKSGSIIGKIHKFQFQLNEEFDNFQLGDTIQGFYYGIAKNKQRLFFMDKKRLELFLENPGNSLWNTNTLPESLLQSNSSRLYGVS
jgi:hypothetical protein